MTTWKKGDTIAKRTRSGLKIRTIISVAQDAIVMSGYKTPEFASPTFTQQELEGRGYRLYTAPPVVKKTVADIERELGLPPGSLNIVK